MGAAPITPDSGPPDPLERLDASAASRLTPLRELQLVQAYRDSGDSSAMAELLTAYQRRVYAVCRRMLGDPDVAADLTQDSLIKVMEGLHTFDGRAKLSTWVIRVTMNCCLSHLRKARIRRHGSLDVRDDDGLANLPEAPEPSVVERIERKEALEAAERALGRLEPLPRAILILRDLQGLEYQQIAQVLEIPVGTVKSRIFRARAGLRELIEEEARGAESNE